MTDNKPPSGYSEESSTAEPLAFSRRLSSLRLAANRRNARKSTGPRSKAGKFRSALNAGSHQFCSEALERELRARGEDPREFCRLHRDLAAIFHPSDAVTCAAVELLARTWWQKARRERQWVGAGAARFPELDNRLDAMLMLISRLMGDRRLQWKSRLTVALGGRVGSPSEVRHAIERQLSPFANRAEQRSYGLEAANQTELQAYFEDALLQITRNIIARQGPKEASEPKRTQRG